MGRRVQLDRPFAGISGRRTAELARGKGNKILGIPGPKHKAGEERMTALVVIGPDEGIQVQSGQRTMTLKWEDLGHYDGNRGRRGMMLPRGWRKVERVTRIAIESVDAEE